MVATITETRMQPLDLQVIEENAPGFDPGVEFDRQENRPLSQNTSDDRM